VGRFLRASDTLKQEMLYIAVPIRSENKTIGVLRLSLFLKEMGDVINHFRLNIFLITLIILSISLFIAYLFSRSLSKPIKELSSASQKVAQQDFNVRVFLKGNDELKELADSFNSMVLQMRSLFSQLTHQKEELNSIISSLQEGLLVLDRHDMVLICNDSFTKMTSKVQTKGKFYWEAFREPQFDELIKKVRDIRHNCVEEIEFNQKVFLCSATLLEMESEIAVVFHDITGIKNLERIKTDFVLNVSHELRTPLTAIKGFVETLEETTNTEEGRHYLSIIMRNTDRLINIVTDLLSVSELEAKGVSPQFTEVDLADIIENVLKIFDQRLKDKNISAQLFVEENFPIVLADPFSIEQMFINLVDNAVKYSEKGKITISLGKTEEGIIIKVQDTGAGIPREHLPRIFERFYVVDKSRSKKMGGTGLGLSIVKHVVLVHRGTISVESSVGLGTTFLITLPNPIPGKPLDHYTLSQN
jgi:two-component system, OmpR family, phosphate regulon sensor histidine kinase PhoR